MVEIKPWRDFYRNQGGNNGRLTAGQEAKPEQEFPQRRRFRSGQEDWPSQTNLCRGDENMAEGIDVVSTRVLDVTSETESGQAVRAELESAVVGQPDGVNYFVGLVEQFKSRLYDTNRPIGSVLITGPTGSGKTFCTEAFAEALQPIGARDSKLNMVKIDCGEFQHSHEISKLIGSPPGYLGHRETPALLSTDRISKLQTNEAYPFAIILFDEIEKACDSLWHILLAVLDKGVITLGTNERVDLTRTIIVMTSNAGSSGMFNNALGFKTIAEGRNDAEIKHIGIEAAKRKFSVEFINRLDGVVAFNALLRQQVSSVLNRELGKLQNEIFTKCTPKLLFRVGPRAKTAMLDEGYNPKYNARNIRRVLDKHLRLPMARIIASKQCSADDAVLVDYKDGEYIFQSAPLGAVGLVTHGSKEDDFEDIL